MQIHVLLEPDRTPDQLTALAQACETHGIDAMWTQNYLSSREPFMSLVPAALATRKVTLGVCVISPHEMHPVKMASSLHSLNEYANGRAALVIGGGGEWAVRLQAPGDRRVRRVSEAIDIVKGSAPDRALNYPGQIYKVWSYQPKWATAPAPLVYAGANRPQMLRAATRVADGVMFSDMTHGLIDDAVGAVRSGLAEHRRDAAGYRINNIWAWHIKPDNETAQREARREVLLRGLLERWYLESFLDAEECDYIEAHKEGFYKAYRGRHHRIDGVPDALVQKLVDNFSITGTVEDLERRMEELERFAAAGVTELNFRLHDDPLDAIALIGRHVVPRFR